MIKLFPIFSLPPCLPVQLQPTSQFPVVESTRLDQNAFATTEKLRRTSSKLPSCLTLRLSRGTTFYLVRIIPVFAWGCVTLGGILPFSTFIRWF